MGHYITLIRYTQQGAAKIKESPARLDKARKAAEAAGGKIHAWYLTMGKYDAVIVSEFPNDEASAKLPKRSTAKSLVLCKGVAAKPQAQPLRAEVR